MDVWNSTNPVEFEEFQFALADLSKKEEFTKQKLLEQIDHLTQQVNSFQNKISDIQDQSTSNTYELLVPNEKESTKLPHVPDSLQALLGVSIHYTDYQKLQDKGGITLMQHTIKGTLNDLNFHVQFTVELGITTTIKSLSIFLPEEMNAELNNFVRLMESEKSLQGFFRGFMQYSKIVKQRITLFNHIETIYPDLTHFPNGKASNLMHIYSRSNMHIQLVFLWNIYCVNNSTPLPIQYSVDLIPKISTQVLKLDNKNNFTTNFKDNFIEMVRLKGLQPTLQQIIKTCFPQ